MRAISVIAIALFNSFWQSGIVAALVWLALKFAGRINAATRYVIWWTVLAIAILLPVAPRLRRAHPAPVVAAKPAGIHYLKTPVLVAPNAFVTMQDEPSAHWPLLILGVWTAVLLYRMGQTSGSYLYLRRVKRRARVSMVPVPAVSRSIRILLSGDIESPLAVGFLHPAIVLPASLPGKLGAAELNHIVLHEAAHLARWDDWTNLLARLAGALLALHPVALWILQRIDHEREMACDDWAVARIGSARTYAESLAHMCELQWSRRRDLLATGVLGWGSRIGGRIEVLLRRGREFSPRVSISRVAASAAVLLGLFAAASVAPRCVGLAQRLEFEVASVKRNTTNGRMIVIPERSGDRVTIHNNQIGSVILYAYNVKIFQVVGDLRLPDGWNWYDIEAKVAGSPTDDQIRLMLQSLLEDRFKLKVHRESREMAVYKLAIAKNRPKLKTASDGFAPTIDGKALPSKPFCLDLGGVDGEHIIGKSATVAQLLSALSGPLGGPVVDGTGLQGTFDFDVVFERRNPLDTDTASPLPAAVQQQLGLKLERSRAPVEVLVIDHLERPSEN